MGIKNTYNIKLVNKKIKDDSSIDIKEDKPLLFSDFARDRDIDDGFFFDMNQMFLPQLYKKKSAGFKGLESIYKEVSKIFNQLDIDDLDFDVEYSFNLPKDSFKNLEELYQDLKEQAATFNPYIEEKVEYEGNPSSYKWLYWDFNGLTLQILKVPDNHFKIQLSKQWDRNRPRQTIPSLWDLTISKNEKGNFYVQSVDMESDDDISTSRALALLTIIHPRIFRDIIEMQFWKQPKRKMKY